MFCNLISPFSIPINDMTSPPIPVAELKKMLCNQLHLISQQDRQEILNYALQELPGKKFITSGAGTLLSLDASIPDAVILKMHDMVQSRLIMFDPSDFKE